MLEVKDAAGKRYSVLNLVDYGTSFQQAIVLVEGGGQPTSNAIVRALQDHWFNWAGIPKNFVTDRGTPFRGACAKYLAQQGVQMHFAPLETPQTISKVEKHGGLLKATLRRVVQESQIEGLEAIKEAISECVSVKNDLIRHHGYSPAQHVLGKAPRRPGSCLDDAEDVGTLKAMTDETNPFYTRYRARAEAKKAFIHLETSKRVAKALAKNAAPILHDYQVGDLVVYRRDNVLGVQGTVWSTTSRIIGKESEHSIWVLNEGLPVLVPACGVQLLI